MLKGKKIILGVTGSIAAYKACQIVTALKKENADVIVIMTEEAKHFITPLSLGTLSGHKVITDMFDGYTPRPVEHVSLAEEADMLLIAPATANVIGKLAAGLADDMLTCVALATLAPKVICPAMNTNMYKNPLVVENINKLKKLGFIFIEPQTGRLASGAEGEGRLADIDAIINGVKKSLKKTTILKRKPS
jgi:phosphopantothenoylcysteine decarboxylase / phosphopantothenate---cysteine ligase